MDIVALLQCLQPYVPATTLRQCSRIVRALLVMTGRLTMLGMSRWAGKGGSYRTIERFFATVVPWSLLFWVFFRHQVYCPGDVYLVAGDDVIVTKAGTCTHGLDRFFASLYGKPVPGLAFFTLSLVSVQARRSFPLRVEQVVRSEAEQAASKAKAAAKKPKTPCEKRRPGRPKGRKNKPKADGTGTPELRRIAGWLDALLHLIAGVIPLTYLVLDGHFGNHNALQMARQCGLHLISKLRCDAALYIPYTGPYAGRGPPPQVWPQDRLRPPPGAIPQRDHGGGAHPDLCLSGTVASQGVPAAAECRQHRQDQPAHPSPRPCRAVQQ